ncbi:gamma-glutamyl-gamma-aminobutyrate hydrolase family protein [Roseibium limicola]|uniref:gamma-glutamyl-gamma-aminobutyrate hydrolase n=1 Tax=Roseibium limicola TaxID=2816037 RepID=A0A939ESV3_9HYPH|nr:gamma-glutamyl-gamma-aminobutyrate hydrolase family protein [Roseibium limicola]MBO0346998.1 gamma-glutamyl-gamma-aminobutyrate hydrolase family protein [Roseibium limicola]
MPKPLVLVSADVKFFEGYSWHAAPDTYLKALINTADVTPLVLPSFGDEIDIDGLLERVDGVLATGSRSNVSPDLYGEEPTEANGPYDPGRDATTLPLLRKAIEKGVPVFAICRGMQELNVAMGGTLHTEIQDIDGRHDHRAPTSDVPDERFRIAHPIQVEEGSCIAGIFGGKPVAVNSLHRQAVGTLGKGLKVEARAEDGTVEAVTAAHAPGYVMATQWHPEYWASSDEPSQQLFKAFGDATRAYAATKSGT